MSSRWLLRRVLVLVAYGLCALVFAGVELSRGRAHSSLVASVMHVRAWLMTNDPPPLRALGSAFDRGLHVPGDSGLVRLRGLGLALFVVGAGMVAAVWIFV